MYGINGASVSSSAIPPLVLGFLVTEVTLHGDHGISHKALVLELDHLGRILVTVEHMNDGPFRYK